MNSPEKTPKELTKRNGEAAETINATAVVSEVKNIAKAERLKSAKDMGQFLHSRFFPRFLHNTCVHE